MPRVAIGRAERAPRLIDSAERRGDGQIERRAAAQQSVDGLELAVDERGGHRSVRVGAVVAEQIDERHLRPALARHATRADERQRLAESTRIRLRTGVEERARDLDDVRRHRLVPDRILGDELEQRRLPEVIAALEHDAFVHEVRMEREMSAQAVEIAVVGENHGRAKRFVLDAVDVGAVELRALVALDVLLEPRPSVEAVLARDREMRVGQSQRGRADLRVARGVKARVKLANTLKRVELPRAEVGEQILRLVLQMVEVGTRGQALRRHGTPLSLWRPTSAATGRKVRSRSNRSTIESGLLSCPRTGRASLRTCDASTAARWPQAPSRTSKRESLETSRPAHRVSDAPALRVRPRVWAANLQS